MYAWLWRHLPGPAGVRLLLSVLLLSAVPAVEPLLPYSDVTVNNSH
jgi:hypothetical protein